MVYDQYKKFFKTEKGYKILDNSIIELGSAVEIGSVVEAAQELGAHEIVLTDVYKEGKASLRATDAALTWLYNNGYSNSFKYMAVPQGKNMYEFQECFDTLKEYKEVDVLGIPKYLADYHPRGRAEAEKLWMYGQAGLKEIHLLGCKYSWQELELFKHLEKIRSMDTCLRGYMHIHNTCMRTVGTLDLEAPFPDDIKKSWVASSYMAYELDRRK